jgi:hypothetical protein
MARQDKRKKAQRAESRAAAKAEHRHGNVEKHDRVQYEPYGGDCEGAPEWEHIPRGHLELTCRSLELMVGRRNIQIKDLQSLIVRVAEQQAMPDDWWKEQLATILKGG